MRLTLKYLPIAVRGDRDRSRNRDACRLGKEALDQYHLRHVDQTHSLVAMLREVVIAAYMSR